jgi:hypothetical protein
MNEEKVLIFDVDFHWTHNHPDIFRDYASYKCRFTSMEKNLTYVKYTDAFMESTPVGWLGKRSLPDQIRCRTPIWDYDNDAAVIDISFNDFDYEGKFEFKFVSALSTLRISPLCGPVDGGTKINIYGSGMN